MADGDIQLRVKANAGEAVSEMRKIETAQNKAANAAKRLGEANKRAARESKENWQGVEGMFGKIGKGQIGAFGFATLAIGASVAAMSKALNYLNSQAQASLAATGKANKLRLDTEKGITDKTGAIKGLGTLDARKVVEESGASASDITSIIEAGNKSGKKLSTDQLIAIAKQMAFNEKSGINTDNYIKDTFKTWKNEDNLASAINKSSVAAFVNKKTSQLTTDDNLDFLQYSTNKQFDFDKIDEKKRQYQATVTALTKAGNYQQLKRFEDAVSLQGGVEYSDISRSIGMSHAGQGGLDVNTLIEAITKTQLKSKDISKEPINANNVTIIQSKQNQDYRIDANQ